MARTDLCASATLYTIPPFHACAGPAPPGGELETRPFGDGIGMTAAAMGIGNLATLPVARETLQVSGASNPSREGGPSCTVPPLDAFLMAASVAASAYCADAPASTHGAVSACAASQPEPVCVAVPKSKSVPEQFSDVRVLGMRVSHAWPSNSGERGTGAAGQLRRPAGAP